MSRHFRTHGIPPCPHHTHPTASCKQKFLVNLCCLLVLTGALAGAAAAMFSIIPATSIKVDPTMPGPAGPFKPARLVGLDHTGGDLRRAPRLTRRARRLGFGMPWTDGIAGLPRQANYAVLIAST